MRSRSDADCELFYAIIFDELCEEAWVDQQAELNSFIAACQKLDRQLNGVHNDLHHCRSIYTQAYNDNSLCSFATPDSN